MEYINAWLEGNLEQLAQNKANELLISYPRLSSLAAMSYGAAYVLWQFQLEYVFTKKHPFDMTSTERELSDTISMLDDNFLTPGEILQAWGGSRELLIHAEMWREGEMLAHFEKMNKETTDTSEINKTQNGYHYWELYPRK